MGLKGLNSDSVITLFVGFPSKPVINTTVNDGTRTVKKAFVTEIEHISYSK
jgi:hypothetical protein